MEEKVIKITVKKIANGFLLSGYLTWKEPHVECSAGLFKDLYVKNPGDFEFEIHCSEAFK